MFRNPAPTQSKGPNEAPASTIPNKGSNGRGGQGWENIDFRGPLLSFPHFRLVLGGLVHGSGQTPFTQIAHRHVPNCFQVEADRRTFRLAPRRHSCGPANYLLVFASRIFVHRATSWGYWSTRRPRPSRKPSLIRRGTGHPQVIAHQHQGLGPPPSTVQTQFKFLPSNPHLRWSTASPQRPWAARNSASMAS